MRQSWSPMVDFILDEREKPMLDFVGRFENLDADWKKVTESLGKKILLPKVNTTIHKPYQEEYNATTRKIVEKIYKKDLEYFNYKF